MTRPEELRALVEELRAALQWMVDNDETNEGDVPIPEHHGQTWDEVNAYWIAGLNRARTALTRAESLLSSVPDGGWKPMAARPLDEWHEDFGYAVWWTFRDGEWLGEPSYIGSPLCDDWPGYHTHWTPHPEFPASPQGSSDNG